MTSLELIESSPETFTSLAEVSCYLQQLSSCLAQEAEIAKGKEKHALMGQASGIEFALNALARLK